MRQQKNCDNRSIRVFQRKPHKVSNVINLEPFAVKWRFLWQNVQLKLLSTTEWKICANEVNILSTKPEVVTRWRYAFAQIEAHVFAYPLSFNNNNNNNSNGCIPMHWSMCVMILYLCCSSYQCSGCLWTVPPPTCTSSTGSEVQVGGGTVHWLVYVS